MRRTYLILLLAAACLPAAEKRVVEEPRRNDRNGTVAKHVDPPKQIKTSVELNNQFKKAAEPKKEIEKNAGVGGSRGGKADLSKKGNLTEIFNGTDKKPPEKPTPRPTPPKTNGPKV